MGVRAGARASDRAQRSTSQSSSRSIGRKCACASGGGASECVSGSSDGSRRVACSARRRRRRRRARSAYRRTRRPGTLLAPACCCGSFAANIVRTVRWFGSGAAAPRIAPEAVARSTASRVRRATSADPEDAGSRPTRAPAPPNPPFRPAWPLNPSFPPVTGGFRVTGRFGAEGWSPGVTPGACACVERGAGPPLPGLVRGGEPGAALRGVTREAGGAVCGMEPCRIAVPPGAPLCERPPWRPRPRSTAHRRRRSRPVARTASWRGSREAPLRRSDSVHPPLLSKQERHESASRVDLQARGAILSAIQLPRLPNAPRSSPAECAPYSGEGGRDGANLLGTAA